MIKDTLGRTTTAVVTAAAAAAAAAATGGTAVRCCRVHVCSYTRGLMYVRLAAYRPRRTRSQNGVTQGGGVVRCPRRKRRSGSSNKEGAPAASIKQERDKESRVWNEKRGRVQHSLYDCRGGGSQRVGGERRLQSQENADCTRLRPTSQRRVLGRETHANASAPFSSRVRRLLSAKPERKKGTKEGDKEEEREREQVNEFAYATLTTNRRATCPTRWR